MTAPRVPKDCSKTIKEFQGEMWKIYRETRLGTIKSQQGSKLIWMIKEIVAVARDTDLEKRAEALEGR
jgi:hypothetical protein